jgi:hypothetical protein
VTRNIQVAISQRTFKSPNPQTSSVFPKAGALLCPSEGRWQWPEVPSQKLEYHHWHLFSPLSPNPNQEQCVQTAQHHISPLTLFTSLWPHTVRHHNTNLLKNNCIGPTLHCNLFSIVTTVTLSKHTFDHVRF